MQELKEATKPKGANDTHISLIPSEDNLYVWKALLQVGRMLIDMKLIETHVLIVLLSRALKRLHMRAGPLS